MGLLTVLVISRSDEGPMVMVVLVLLLVLFWSWLVPFTVAMLVMVVLETITCAMMWSIALVFFVSVPMVHKPVLWLYDPLPSSDRYCSPAGSMSIDVTPVALSGPLLCMVMV